MTEKPFVYPDLPLSIPTDARHALHDAGATSVEILIAAWKSDEATVRMVLAPFGHSAVQSVIDLVKVRDRLARIANKYRVLS